MMKKRSGIAGKVYNILFGIILACIFIVIPIRSDIRSTGYTQVPISFSEKWRVGSEPVKRIEQVMAGEHGGTVILEKRLPARLSEKDSLCFESQNSNLSVFIDDELVYSFRTKENLTGRSTGIVFHEVGIGTSNISKTVKIINSCCYDRQKTGRIMNVYICPPSDYMRLTFRRMLGACIYCILMILFGGLQMLVYRSVPDKDTLPFNIRALGLTSIIAGMWLFIDTNVMQVFTGSIYAWRGMSKVLPFLVGYPLIAFFNSLTVRKRKIYQHISFWMSIFFEIALIGSRYLLNMDMAYSFSLFLIPYIVLVMLIMLIIANDNAHYCRVNGLAIEIRSIYFIIIFVLGCGLLDLIKDFTDQTFTDVQGIYTRAGMVIFVVYMNFKFLKWWTKDHAQIMRERFINHALQYAVSSDSPEHNIKAMLNFMGTELEADRIFIFESQINGTFRGSYEWCRDGLKPESVELIHLTYEGVLDKLYKRYLDNGRKFIVNDIEQFKSTDPYFYDILKNYKIENLVTGALEINGKFMGICGVSGAPEDKLTDISEIINLISYFLSQLILQREEQKRMFSYNYRDALSGAKNHMAYRMFLENSLDMSKTFGYMRVGIIGLEDVNREQGYDVGDRILIELSKCLMEIFGSENVYRMNGNEFVCFGFETEESYFDNDVECAKRMIERKGINIFVGAAYCANGTTDMEIVFSRVDELMQEDLVH